MDILAKAKEEQARKLLASGRSPAGTVDAAQVADKVNTNANNVITKAAADSTVSAAQDGNAFGTIGGGMMTAGMMAPSPASPYLMAGGLGLTVLGAGEANKRKEKEAQRQAYNERIKARQQALNNIANIRLE